MRYNYPTVDRPPRRHVSHHTSSNFFQSAEQPIPVSVGYPDPNSGHSHEYFWGQMGALEAVQRQLEKERIREEIIAQENTRRRILEAEVRMELMMEREAAMLSGDGLRQQSESRSLEERIMRLIEERLGVGTFGAGVAAREENGRSHLRQQSEGRSLEERIMRLIDERLGVGTFGAGVAARGENGRSQTVPFHERSNEPWTSSEQHNVEPNVFGVSPASERGKEKEIIIFKANPDASVSGVKRKAETAPEAVSIPKKRFKEEWSCALCQVSATSEDGLIEHLRGMKHKYNEAALKAQRSGKSCCIGFFPEGKNAASLQIGHNADGSKEKNTARVRYKRKHKVKGCPDGKNAASLQIGHNADGSKEKNTAWVRYKRKHKVKGCPEGKNAASLQIGHNADGSKEKNTALVRYKRKHEVNKRKKYEFWCENCNVGAFNEKVMEGHKKGKKHLSSLKKMKCDDTTEKVNNSAEGTKENHAVPNSKDCRMTDDARSKETSLHLLSLKGGRKGNDAPSLQIDHIVHDSKEKNAALVQNTGETVMNKRTTERGATATEKVNDNAEGTKENCKISALSEKVMEKKHLSQDQDMKCDSTAAMVSQVDIANGKGNDNAEGTDKDCEMTDDAGSKQTSSHVFSMKGHAEGNDAPSLQNDHIVDDSKEKNAALIQNEGKTKMNDDAEETKENCKIGAFSEKVMEGHGMEKHSYQPQAMKCDSTAAVVTRVDIACQEVIDNIEGSDRGFENTVSHSKDCEMVDDARFKETSSPAFSMKDHLEGNDAPSLQNGYIADDSKEKNVVLVQNTGKAVMNKRRVYSFWCEHCEIKYRFWCEHCETGTTVSVEVMEDHKKVMEHLSWAAAMETQVDTATEKVNDDAKGTKDTLSEKLMVKKHSFQLQEKGNNNAQVTNKHCEKTDDARCKETSSLVFSMKGRAEGSNAPSLLIDYIADDSKEKNVELVQNKGKTKVNKRKYYAFWCDHCKIKFRIWCEHSKIGTLSGEVMEDHKIGKKQLSWFKKMKCDGMSATEKVNDIAQGTKENCIIDSLFTKVIGGHGMEHRKGNDNAEGTDRDRKNTVSNSKDCEMTDDVRSRETSLHVFSIKGCPEGNDAPPLQIDHIANDSKDKSAAFIQSKGDNAMNKRSVHTFLCEHCKIAYKFWCEHCNIKYTFWCGYCEIGATSLKVMDGHKKGMNHLSWLQKQKCDGTAALATQVDTANKRVNDDAKGTKENFKTDVLSENLMEKKHSSQLQDIKCDSTAAVVTQAFIASEKGNDEAEATEKDCENTSPNKKDHEIPYDDARSKETSSHVFSMKGCAESSNAPSLQIDYIVDDSKEKNVAPVQNKGKIEVNKKRFYSFWCLHCKIKYRIWCDHCMLFKKMECDGSAFKVTRVDSGTKQVNDETEGNCSICAPSEKVIEKKYSDTGLMSDFRNVQRRPWTRSQARAASYSSLLHRDMNCESTAAVVSQVGIANEKGNENAEGTDMDCKKTESDSKDGVGSKQTSSHVFSMKGHAPSLQTDHFAVWLQSKRTMVKKKKKKNEGNFQCAHCNANFTENSLEQHKNGKKYLSWLKKIKRKGTVAMATQAGAATEKVNNSPEGMIDQCKIGAYEKMMEGQRMVENHSSQLQDMKCDSSATMFTVNSQAIKNILDLNES